MDMVETRKNPERPIIGVGAVVFQDNKVLLVRRAKPPKKGEWSLPGGAQKTGETIQEALLREIKEETGLTVRITGFIDVVDYIEHDTISNKLCFHYTLLDYTAVYVAGALKAASDAEAAKFFGLEEALALPLWSETKRIIKLAAKQTQTSHTLDTLEYE